MTRAGLWISFLPAIAQVLGGAIARLVITGTFLMVSAVSAGGQAPELSPELQKLRAAMEKYQDPLVAVRDGYRSTLACDEFYGGAPDRVPYVPGGMGVHFGNQRISGPVPDPMRPNVLLYEPDGDKFRLVAVEWLIPLATGIKERPQLYGRPFDGPMEGHHPTQPPDLHHYDLHVWLFKDNPAGLFSPTNPTVKCGSYGFTFKMEPPRIVPHP